MDTIGKDAETPAVKGYKERLYDKVKLPLWAIDVFIALAVLALIFALYIGTRP
ncbi:MAG: hypothetical protein PHQ85_00205 [Eubacteriales bacterium]|nr:hypothetical protein [Eubacteriales bacterium]MDD4104384.1 hypothetical protein [Eubacteriales bacterium]MDD4709669.1 hypothetical protein [Eubacteriales bacterium]NLO16328.1 hypothetical protein [Clostridiales bacterium]